MPNNYDFLDAHSSILTARSSITAGSAHEPYVQVTSFLSVVPVSLSGNPSISGTVNIGNIPQASVHGAVSVAGGSVSLEGVSDIAGSVISRNILPSSMLVGASIFGLPPVNVTNTNLNVSGSVVAFQGGTKISSVVGSIPSSLLTGSYGHRNDNVASFLGGNLTWNPLATDSAGRSLTKPFAAEEARIEGYASTVNASVTTLVGAAGAGLRNYITDIWFANTGASATLVTFRSGGGASILGYTIAPAGSGSNLQGLATPIRTLANQTFDIQATTATSILFATVKGYKAP